MKTTLCGHSCEDCERWYKEKCEAFAKITNIQDQLNTAAILVGKKGMEIEELKKALQAGLAVAEKADAKIAKLRALCGGAE